MNSTKLKALLCLVLMIFSVMQAFISNDIICGKLFASIGILTEALASSIIAENEVVEE